MAVTPRPLSLARQALAGLPLSDRTTRRYAFVCLGMALRHQGELPAAADALAQADTPGQDLEQAPAPARGLATLAGIQIWMGELVEAEATCRRILALHEDHLRRCGRRLPIAAFGYARLSEVLRQRNRLEEALHAARESRALAEQWQQTDALYESYTHLARALHSSGDPVSALTLLHRLERVVQGRSPWLHAMSRGGGSAPVHPQRTGRHLSRARPLVGAGEPASAGWGVRLPRPCLVSGARPDPAA